MWQRARTTVMASARRIGRRLEVAVRNVRRSPWKLAIIGLIAVCAIATGVWTAVISMPHGFVWACLQGVKAIFDFVTWLIIVTLFVAGGVLVVRYA
jgi:hypothetical protein